MKKNIFLRVALWMMIGVWASNTLLTGTWAKYVASGSGEAKARFASFSFEMGSYKPSQPAAFDTSGNLTAVAKGPPFSSTMTWDEVVINPYTGIGKAIFEFPMFDYEYTNSASHLVGPDITVKSSNNDMVIAPGTGFYWYGPGENGVPKNNPNHFREPDLSWYCLQFRNNSEVRVRFDIAVDPAPVSTGFPGLKLYIGAYPESGIPLTGTTPIAIPQLSRELGPNETYTSPNNDLYFNWAWLFEDGQDAADTALGEAGTGIVKIPLIITVTQID